METSFDEILTVWKDWESLTREEQKQRLRTIVEEVRVSKETTILTLTLLSEKAFMTCFLRMCFLSHLLQPIEPKAMDIVELKNQVQGKLCLIGNVDVDLLARGTPKQIRQKTRDLLRDVAPGGGYCLGSGNSVPNYVQVENYRAMVETVHEFGSYPITL